MLAVSFGVELQRCRGVVSEDDLAARIFPIVSPFPSISPTFAYDAELAQLIRDLERGAAWIYGPQDLLRFEDAVLQCLPRALPNDVFYFRVSVSVVHAQLMGYPLPP